jgi:signal transduction histidine kinase/CheY-like chemotaxis protein/HAMP domain-containing protein
MTSIFKRLTLPAKLILLALLPLTFLLLLAFQYNREKKGKLELLQTYCQRVEQASLINLLIDELQTERRLSFGYGLKGNWQNEMVLQRSRTDAVLSRLDTARFNLPGLASYTFLDQLKAFRGRLDKGQVQPLLIVNFYTNVIFRLSSLTSVTAGNVNYLQPVAGVIAGQKLLSDIITYWGISRSQLYLMLETKEENAQLITSINQLQEILDTYVKEFYLKAPPHAIRGLNALMNDLDVKAVNAIQRRLRETGRLDTTVSGEYWWNISAAALDKIKLLQRQLIEEARQGTEEIYQRERRSYTLTWILLLVMLLTVAVFIVFTIRIITGSLQRLSGVARQLAIGKTGLPIEAQADDVVGELAESIRRIDQNNQVLAAAAKAIGEGDFSVSVQPRSEEDTIGNAIRHMKSNLQSFSRANEEKLWIQTGVGRVNDSIRGDKSVKELCAGALEELISYLEGQQGVFYTAEGDHLARAAQYAIASEAPLPELIRIGETLIGQAARRDEIMVVGPLAEEQFAIRSGLATLMPQQLVLVPLWLNGELLGVMEMGFLQQVPPFKLDFIREVTPDIAIGLHAAKSRMRLQELYEQTQSQAEELQAQHSELENINAELEAQAEKLQVSEEELKVQQEELMQANQELEERTRLLEERNQLIADRNVEIQRKAEELALSTRYKSEFLANMSHELRTPLNSILLLSRLLSENNRQTLSADEVEYARVIQSSGQGLLSLIDEILDLSKIEAGKMELEFSAVPLRELVQELRDLFSPIAAEKGLSLDMEIEEGVPALLETDRLRLGQVLKNLFSNALKFTSKGGVTLSVRALPDNPHFILFAVKDTGIGIPQDKQHLIFEAFQQADGSTRRRFGGTGLGLSISRELTRLLGGEIRLASEEGKGSEFTLYLPVRRQAEAPPALPEREEREPEKASSNLPAAAPLRATVIPESLPDDRHSVGPGDRTILIVEDDTAFARALIDFTRQKGYKALAAVRGDEGIELARQYRPLGILLDLQLPVRDGWEVMEELKANPQTRHIPVHIMSSQEAKRESLLRGAIDFINKPLAFEQMQEVFSRIERFITRENRKVLIVEENPKHAQALAYFLENFNIHAQIAPSMQSGVEALQQEAVDCVILDMGLPDQSAFETLELLKQRQGLENLPVIIFTGKSLSKNEETRIRQYADSIVVKTAHSYQRILDEVSLFLHLMEETGEQATPSNHFKRLGALQEVLAGKRILIADDDVRNIFSLTRALEVQGMQVLSATDGREAVEQLKANPGVDLVLMDIMMPEMDGYAAMQEIRRIPQFRKLPIIAVTAKAMAGDREKCIQAGASDYISKPVDIDQLLSLLRVWLYDRGAGI